MATTINEICVQVRRRGFMTEKDMKLLKNRFNKEQRDCFDYTFGAINNGYGIPLDEEWANKEMKWMKSMLKKNGDPKSWANIGYREAEIIQNAMPEDFRFMGFYDAGVYGVKDHIPVYWLRALTMKAVNGGMKYYVYRGNINIIG